MMQWIVCSLVVFGLLVAVVSPAFSSTVAVSQFSMAQNTTTDPPPDPDPPDIPPEPKPCTGNESGN